MTTKEKLILLFDNINLSYKSISFLIENFTEKELVLELDTCRKSIVDNLGESIFLKLKNAISVKNVENMLEKLRKFNISPVFIWNDEYPAGLKEIVEPPFVLYTKGDVSLLNKNIIAIIGTRKPTAYGREVTRLFASELSKAGLVTVSGLAYGLDMEVAISSLEVKGKTIAVLGGGLDKIYPEQNTNLAEKIVEDGGLLVSLYPPGRRPMKHSFLERNRIISGLALGLVITEAGESSGTLNTANHAIEQGKELFVVPGNITSIASKGTNKLIEELPDSYTIDPKHVLKVLNIESINKETIQKIKEVSENEKIILSFLYEKEMEFDELLCKTNMESKTLISLLTIMEINGLIKKLPGNIYSL